MADDLFMTPRVQYFVPRSPRDLICTFFRPLSKIVVPVVVAGQSTLSTIAIRQIAINYFLLLLLL